MADKKEMDLAVPGSIDVDLDYIRMLSGDVSVKQDFAVVAEAIIEDYEGSTLGAEARSIKAAIDSVYGMINTINYDLNDPTVGLQARSVTVDELTALEARLDI